MQKTLMLRRIEGRRRKGRQRMKWLDGIIHSMDISLSKFWDIVKEMRAWCAAVYGVTMSQTQLSNNNQTWKEGIIKKSIQILIEKNNIFGVTSLQSK